MYQVFTGGDSRPRVEKRATPPTRVETTYCAYDTHRIFFDTFCWKSNCHFTSCRRHVDVTVSLRYFTPCRFLHCRGANNVTMINYCVISLKVISHYDIICSSPMQESNIDMMPRNNVLRWRCIHGKWCIKAVLFEKLYRKKYFCSLLFLQKHGSVISLFSFSKFTTKIINNYLRDSLRSLIILNWEDNIIPIGWK